MLESIIIVGIVFSIPLTAIITSHRRKVVRIQYDLLQKEVELEKLKQQNYLIETEKMKVELEQMKLVHHSEKDELFKIDQNS